MRNKRDGSKRPTPFGWYILDHMAAAGLHRPADLARATQTSRATIGRWLYEPSNPDTASLLRLAAALGRPFAEVAEQSGRPAETPPPATMHPLAGAINEILSDTSPETEADRRLLEEMLTRIIGDPKRST